MQRLAAYQRINLQPQLTTTTSTLLHSQPRSLTRLQPYLHSLKMASTSSSSNGSTVKHPDLKDPSLFKQKAYVNGKWIDSTSGKTIDVFNPASGDKIGTVPDCNAEDTKQAIAAAKEAFKHWKFTTADHRAQVMRKWFKLMQENSEDLGRLMTIEQGKPLKEAIGEVTYASGFFDVFASEATRVFGEVIPAAANNTRILVMRQPVGVVGAITPWNFPAAMITRKAGAAVAAGCTVVLKPSEFTPYSAYALAELGERAGLPPGVFNILTGDAKQIGGELTSSPDVAKITFTGSTGVGRLLMKQSAETVKRVSLELGGNAPFIVFDDADIDSAVKGAVANKFRNAGQTCVTANRIYVQRGVYDKFSKAFSEAVEKLKVGDGLKEGVFVGPLINENAITKVKGHIDDATKHGAKVLTGGKRFKPEEGLTDQFFQPTVVGDVTKDMKVATEETFGPAAFLFPFDTEEEVIAAANNTIFGLASYFYTNSPSRQWRVMERLEYGMVGVNNFTVSAPNAPFGGVKQSGLGREGSHLGLTDFLDIKAIHIGIDDH